jgi:predicted SAM-dependent methyltransferase
MSRFNIALPFKPTDKVIELGGGTNPSFRPNVDIRPGPTVDFNCDLNNPYGPYTSCPFDWRVLHTSFDGVYSQYALEHVSWRNVGKFVEAAFRLLRPGGRAVFVVPNLIEQAKYVLAKENAGEFGDNEVCCIFGDQNYEGADWRANSHTAGFSPSTIIKLFRDAGFADVLAMPHPNTDTDMIIEARKPDQMEQPVKGAEDYRWSKLPGEPVVNKTKIEFDCENLGVPKPPNIFDLKEKTSNDVAGMMPHEDGHAGSTYTGMPVVSAAENFTPEQRKEAYGQAYFNGGGKFGGYSREGYWDYPVHELTFQKIMALKPESVLELGCARGYILKRLEDAGVRVCGLEVSEHCYQTRAIQNIKVADFTKTPWDLPDQSFDLCFSNAVMEHIPEKYLPAIKAEIVRVCKRSLHGISFKDDDDGFDKTHTTLHDPLWWNSRLTGMIVDKEELERGTYIPMERQDDGMTKLNIGSFRTMFGYGWMNIDKHPMHDFAKHWGFKFNQMDAVLGMSVMEECVVDLIYSAHFLEHLDYRKGFDFLKQCYRAMKPGATMRLIVPNTRKILDAFVNPRVGKEPFSEFSGLFTDEQKNLPIVMKLWDLLCRDHLAAYDVECMHSFLLEAGFTKFKQVNFREGHKQILKETTDSLPEVSLYFEVVK